MEGPSVRQTPNLSGMGRLRVPFDSAWRCPYQVCKGSIGIENPGVLCYRNVVLQLLLHTPIFLNFLEYTTCTEKHCTICLLKNLANAYWAVSRSPEQVPESLRALWLRLANLYWKNKVDIKQQQDALEFFDHYLFRLSSESKHIYAREMFKIVTMKQFQCHECHWIDDQGGLEEQYHITANFPDGYKRCGVNEAIIPGMQSSIMSRRCDYCKETTNHTIRDSIVRLPEVLLVQVNRYDGTGEKLQKEIKIKEYLTISDCIRNDESMDSGDATYELYSINFHHGSSTHCGHYTIAVKTPHGLWNLLNDDADVQTKSSLKEMKDFQGNKFFSDAYILAYRRLPLTEGIYTPPLVSRSDSPKDSACATVDPTDSDGDHQMSDDAPPASNSDDDLDSLFDAPLDPETEKALRCLESVQLHNQLHEQLSAPVETLMERSSSEVANTEAAPEGVSLYGSVRLLKRDIEWTVEQQLGLLPDDEPLIKLGPRRTVQHARINLSLTHQESGEVLKGESTISLKPGQIDDPEERFFTPELPQTELEPAQPQLENPRTQAEAPGSKGRTPIRERLRPRGRKTTTQVMNTKSSSSGSEDGTPPREVSPAAKPLGVSKKTNPEQPKVAGKGVRKPSRRSKPATKKLSSTDVTSHATTRPGSEHWVRRSKRRYNPVNYEELMKSPDGSSSS